jgi:DNA-binding transcriptional regulator of glucitol operon
VAGKSFSPPGYLRPETPTEGDLHRFWQCAQFVTALRALIAPITDGQALRWSFTQRLFSAAYFFLVLEKQIEGITSR